jgi:SSS family solute:Na+ symporter
MQIYEAISVGLYLLLMIGIGVYSYKINKQFRGIFNRRKENGAAVTALSAGAADMSGWLLMGVPGAMYLSGISSSWIAIGLTTGAFLNYIIVAPRLRIYTEVAQNAITLPVFLKTDLKIKSPSEGYFFHFYSRILYIVYFCRYGFRR